jgi:hypothetical protein
MGWPNQKPYPPIRRRAMLDALKYVLNFEWLTGLGMTASKSVFLILFVVIGVLVLMLPKDYIYEGVKDRRWWHNLKLWAIGDLVFIFVTYYIF